MLGRCGILHVPGKHYRRTRRIGCRLKGQDWQIKDNITIDEEHLELKTTICQTI